MTALSDGRGKSAKIEIEAALGRMV